MKYKVVKLYDNLIEEEAFQLERKTIEDLVFNEGYGINIQGYYKKEKYLVNATWGGEGISGHNPLDSMTKGEIKKRNKKISEAMSGENNPNYGKYTSEETSKKISEAMSGENNPNYGKSDSIYMLDKNTYEIIMRFDNTSKAKEYIEKKLNKSIMTSGIIKCANGKKKSIYGYIWRWAKDINTVEK